jgi:hypothetical protein
MRSSTAAATATTNDSMYYTSASPHPPTQGRSKRWATHSVDEQFSGDEEQEQEDQDVDDEPKPRSKRARASNASSNASSSSRGGAAHIAKGSTSATGGSSSAQGPVSANDKEQRKQARMIRNRSEFDSNLSSCRRAHPRRTPRSSRTGPRFRADAAQASRDRKKEHTQYLETRVAQLEAQLGLAPTSSAPVAPSPSNSGSGPRSHRSNSISSLASNNTTSTPRVTELEEENEVLRTQLHSEQMETARLRGRLESLEDKFNRFEQFMAAPLSTAAPDPLATLPSPTSFAPASTTPAPFEPTFAFDTVKTEDHGDEDLPLLPIHHHASAVESGASSPTSSNSSRLVAREVEISLPRKLLAASSPTTKTTLSRNWSRRPSRRLLLLPLAHSTWTTLPSPTRGAIGRVASRSRRSRWSSAGEEEPWRRTTLPLSSSTFPTSKTLL